MTDWFDVRIKTEAGNFNAVRNKILGWPEHVAQEVYWPELEQIGKDTVALIRDIIEKSETETGRKRAARGGNGPGRIKSGKMYNSVTYRARKRKGGFSLFAGWIRGVPGYAIFQEHGFMHMGKAVEGGEPGEFEADYEVPGINALFIAQEYMLSRVRAMAAGRFEGHSNDVVEGLADE